VTEAAAQDTGSQAAGPQDARTLPRIEIATAVLLSLSGLISAWAGYQASLWGGQQADHYAEANAITTEATRLYVVAGQAVATDKLMFIAWLEAAADGDGQRMTFFQLRFSPELKNSFEQWRARLPANLRSAEVDLNAPVVDLLPRYKESVEARRLQGEAATEFAQGDTANGNSDRFVAGTAMLSLVLFLAGISPLLKSSTVRITMLALAGVIGIAASIFIFTLPAASL
jgi:hypothetical protein